MARQDIRSTKVMGRPKTVSADVTMGLRLPKELAERIKAWTASQPTPRLSRSEAIRRLLQKALAAETPALSIEERITEVKERLAVPDVEKTPSPAQGMEKLRRGLAENELRTLKQKRASDKPKKK